MNIVKGISEKYVYDNTLDIIIPNQDIYDSYNNLIFSNDVRVISKLFQRFKFFEKIKHLPGDIVELGVFKGSGIALWCKLLELNCTYSNKKVIGFDFFDSKNTVVGSFQQGKTMQSVYDRVEEEDLTLEGVEKNLKKLQLSFPKHILVKGDVVHTTKEFTQSHPGLRIALLYIDVDLSEPTYHSLCNLWEHIIPGGYIVFDEYELHKFDECVGVDKFLKEKNIEYNVISTNMFGPTAYMIKK
jgi:hypothetical protein